MKKTAILPIIMLLSWLGISDVAAQQAEQTEEPIAFKVDVWEMLPLRYQSRMLSSGYSVDVHNDSVFCYLPYMGQVQTPEFENSGLTFERPLLAFKSVKGKKGKTNIAFVCRKNMVTYQFNLTVYPNGRCSIRLTPSNADSIGYEGELVDTTM